MLLSIKRFYRFSLSHTSGLSAWEGFCLNTTQLECFLAVASNLNFSRAAEQLRLTQPAVSHQINSLEDELGVKLFNRTSKSVRLTQAGYLYTQYAGEILRLFNVSKGRLKAAREEQQRILGIGCRNTLEMRLLASALAELRRTEPGFVPAFRVVPHNALENLLYDGEIQIMPTFKENAPRRAVYRELSVCRVVCAVAEGHPLAGRECVSAQDMLESGLIAVSRPDASPRSVTAVQNQLIAGSEPGGIIFSESLEALSSVVAAGFAAAVLADTPGIRISGVRYIPVEGADECSYGAAYMADELTPLLRSLMRILVKYSGGAE